MGIRYNEMETGFQKAVYIAGVTKRESQLPVHFLLNLILSIFTLKNYGFKKFNY